MRDATARLAVAMASGEAAIVLSSRRRRSIEGAEIISSVLAAPLGQPTCDLCQMHPGEAEGLTQDEMADRFGPNYAFVPGGESWTEFVPRATAALEQLAGTHRGQTLIGVTESAMVKASFIAFGKMPVSAAQVIMSDPGSITEWSCLVEGDVRQLGTWRLDRFNETAVPAESAAM